MPWLPVAVDSIDSHSAQYLGDPADLVDAAGLILSLRLKPAWHRRAACRGSGDLFFLGRGDDPRPAKALCDACPVQQPCLDTALAGEEVGIWGGMSERQRRKLRAQPAA